MEVVVIGGSGVIGSKVVAKQATEMLGEGAEDAAEVPPAGDTGTRAVQEQQGRALARFVIAQDTGVDRNLAKRAVVGQFHCHRLASWHTDSIGGPGQWASHADAIELSTTKGHPL